MAKEVMQYNRSTVDGGYEILYNSEYVGSAVTLDTTAFTNDVCLAGTPMAADGTKATAATVSGILLHDVYKERPQGTIVIGGYINTTAAQTHSGVTIDDDTKAALKNVVFM